MRASSDGADRSDSVSAVEGTWKGNGTICLLRPHDTVLFDNVSRNILRRHIHVVKITDGLVHLIVGEIPIEGDLANEHRL